jgi:hypothetical protein
MGKLADANASAALAQDLSHHDLPVLALAMALALQPKPLQELVDKLSLRVGETRGEGDRIPAALDPSNASGRSNRTRKRDFSFYILNCTMHLHLQHQIGSLAIGVLPHLHSFCHLHVCGWFCLACNEETCGLLSASLTLSSFLFKVEVLASENTENGSRKKCTPGKGKQCGKDTLSGPASQDYG